MENFKERARFYGIRAGVVALFIAGFMVHDTTVRTYAFTKDLFFPDAKSYIAPISAHDLAIKADFENPENVATCHAASEQRVYTKEAAELTAKAQSAFAEAAKAELRADRNANYDSLFTNSDRAQAGKSIRDANKSLKATTTK